ncbi:hypothetical protein HC891_22710, partial [Candidatus Gracilibacteria bacterium]|nr:hypothetical protein [Candidatus Gracilibacteria bacterium]
MRLVLLTTALVVLFVLASPARLLIAQTADPTIAEIQANPTSYIDRVVTIVGVAGAAVDENEFLLDDGTGQIVVDTGPPWYRQIGVPTGTSVTITGQIDWMGYPGDRRGVDLDACRVVTPTETIEIRDCAFNGPPPWAGGGGGGGGGDGRDDDFYGVVEQRPAGVAGTWLIGGRTFVASDSTRLEPTTARSPS